MTQLYDKIGAGYAESRPPDSRISDGLAGALALAPGSTVLDVGAGTGKYARAMADRGYSVIAVEPAMTMRVQAMDHPGVRWIEASAERIPLPDRTADGAFVVLALHHFRDHVAGLREIIRVIGDGPLVVFTFESYRLREFWLRDYFRELGNESPAPFWKLPSVANEIGHVTGRRVEVRPFLLPRDLVDKFAAAAWAFPEQFLDPQIRNGISYFSLLPKSEVEDGCARLAADLASGVWDSKYGHLRTQETYDAGYEFIIAQPR